MFNVIDLFTYNNTCSKRKFSPNTIGNTQKHIKLHLRFTFTQIKLVIIYKSCHMFVKS